VRLDILKRELTPGYPYLPDPFPPLPHGKSLSELTQPGRDMVNIAGFVVVLIFGDADIWWSRYLVVPMFGDPDIW
jgi:hypothetical protein